MEEKPPEDTPAMLIAPKPPHSTACAKHAMITAPPSNHHSNDVLQVRAQQGQITSRAGTEEQVVPTQHRYSMANTYNQSKVKTFHPDAN